ncbi:MAG: rRNA maturation RNase YbeY [Acidimicrobiales bacterium]
MAEPANGGRPVVVAVDEQHDLPVDVGRWSRLAGDSLAASGVVEGELNLLFVDEEVMTELNREHMDEDRPTDVLSFPLDADDDDPVGERLIGDIVVCPAYAARQAADHRDDRGHDGSVDDELALLIVHGVLHILGHDHAEADETVRMQAAEDALLGAHHRPVVQHRPGTPA